ncbi:ABC transporter permease [Herbivorax sp. ANBcel31]|uniref:ABC transporter permease n=1 Tax=Herbivorax sp. ANBcel31 TaxID=3069754 RepID=UPI0027B80F81|nr:ABC transporter permease [Herbivorax sp. ANBcel31]MDQ2084838.1 ABC transporter permease [Herbivorax sp. ANBcel31]
MYGSFLSNELKKWTRDPMMKFMLFYPVILGSLARYILPLISDSSGFDIDAYSDFIIVFLVLMTPQLFGAIMAFSVLDDRDDNILTSIKVTPLSVHQFLSFRIVIIFALSFIACAFVMWFSDIGDLLFKNIITISFLASLSAPMTGLFINSLSKNKIEGFAVMKGLGIILIFPVISLFFMDKKELFFSFAPGYWPAKAISSIIRGERLLYFTYNQYYFIGLIYVLILNILSYKVFLKRIKL